MKWCYVLVICLALGAEFGRTTTATSDRVQVRVPRRAKAPTEVTSSITQLFGIMAGPKTKSKICLDWNILSDFFLDIVRNDISKSNRQQISIPDIDRQFSKRIAFVNVKGRFVATGGWFSNLSTVRRTGNVTMTVEAAHLFTIRCEIGLSEVQFGYQHYEVKLKILSPKGRISGHVGSNSIALTVQMDASDASCKATLLELRVVELKDLKLVVTGFGIFNSIVSKIANQSIQKSKDKIIHEIESILASEVRQELKKTQCNEYFGYVLKNAELF